MMRVTLREVLALAEGRKVCLPAIDVAGGQPDFLLGALAAFEAARCPAILLVYAAARPYMSLEACADLVGFHRTRSTVPVVLHLDHGQDEQTVRRALDCGFDSVMFDGSALPLEENIRRTQALAKLAHARGAAIEGEVGRIGAELGDGLGEKALTDPDQARRFVAETGVDLLAPAIGNAHGFYRAEPHLAMDLIEQIAARTGVPLSLHGGTGIPLADVRKAAELGMRKMNVATGIHWRFSEALREAAGQEPDKPPSWSKTLAAGRQAITDAVADYLRQLNVEGLV